MIIRALRVAECGRFDRPVAIEGLSGGLDLLVAPNEAGKSTLVRALRACLFQRHRSAHRDLTALKPYRGGAPTVEVDFDSGGTRWRVRKRFLTERLAEVTSLDGATVARGIDADALLETLVGQQQGRDRFGLVWLDQGATLSSPEPDATGTSALRSLIEGEIEAAHGAGQLRGMFEAVSAALAELVSAHRGQKRGRYLSAHDEKMSAEAACGKARAELDEAEGLIGRLGKNEALVEVRHGPLARATRQRRIAEAEAALSTTREIMRERDVARARVAEARTAMHQVTMQQQALAEALTRLERLRQLAANENREAEFDARRLELEGLLDRARVCAQTADEEERRVAGALATAEALDRRDRASRNLSRALQLQSEAEGALRAVAAVPKDATEIQAARRLSQKAGELAARLEAGAVKISVAYEPGGSAKIAYADGVLQEDHLLFVDREVVLAIPGIGRVSIVPGLSTERDAINAELAAARAELERMFVSVGVEDINEFEAAHEQAGVAREALAAITAEMGVLAPKGTEGLAKELKAAEAILVSLGSQNAVADTGVDLAAMKASAAANLAASASARDQVASLERALASVMRDIAVAEAAKAERDREQKELEASLPPADLRAGKCAEIEAAVARSTAEFNEALRIQSAWDSKVSSPRMLELAEADVAIARGEIERSDQDAAQLRSERAHIEGALEALRREDVAARFAVAEAELTKATEQLSDIELEVSALQMLAGELTMEMERAGDVYSKPIVDRLAPLIEIAFPGAALHLDRDYRITGFARGGRTEDLMRLSDGTREQISVLVRLAFARLLSDRGQSVPLILDDALVFADDARIQRMHRALELGGATHQVFVLSCREQAFAQLRGHRVTLQPWLESRA